MGATVRDNPFLNRAMITARDEFYGRERELTQLLGRVVGSSKAQSCAVVGQRRMGKSSLLKALAHDARAHDPSLLAVFYDLEASRRLSAEKFYSTVLRRLIKSRGDAAARGDAAVAPSAGDDPFDLLQEFLEEHDGEHRFLLLFDEFDTVTQNPAFDADFFSALRYLANTFNLACVTSSYEELTRLCHTDEIRQSPFFNIFTSVELGPMTADETRALVAGQCAESSVSLSADDVTLVRELGGDYPFFVQVAAAIVWEQRYDGADEGLDEEAVRAEFRRQAEPHFGYFLDHLERDEQGAVAALARGEPVSDVMVRRVARRGLTASDSAALFSPQFAAYVRGQRPTAADSIAMAPTKRFDTGLAIAEAETMIEPAASAPLPDRYEVVRRLGHGGFGAVYLARDKVLERRVAVKLVRLDRDGDDSRLRWRFLREAQVLARLRHQHVITVFDYGEWQDQPFIVMEYLDGGTVAERLAMERPLPPGEAARLVAEAALGLHHAHQNELLHRDVKSANLLLDGDGSVVVCDFGLTRSLSGSGTTSSNPHALAGTPAYMAPEQLNDEPLDARADLYALGVVLYELVTGARPFAADSVTGMMKKILYDPPPDPHAAGAPLPDGLAAVMLKALAKSPADRFQDGEELAAALRRFAD